MLSLTLKIPQLFSFRGHPIKDKLLNAVLRRGILVRLGGRGNPECQTRNSSTLFYIQISRTWPRKKHHISDTLLKRNSPGRSAPWHGLPVKCVARGRMSIIFSRANGSTWKSFQGFATFWTSTSLRYILTIGKTRKCKILFDISAKEIVTLLTKNSLRCNSLIFS